MKIALLALCLVFHFFGADAQPEHRRPYLNIAYFGILGTHPGVKIGIQYPLFNLGEERSMSKRNEAMLGANILFYYHRRNQIGLGTMLEVGFRNRRETGLNKEASIGLGYLWSWLPGKIYTSGESVPSVRRAGQWLKTLSLGLGSPLKAGIDQPFWMLKPTLMHLKPFNFASTLNFALDAGFYSY